MVATARKIKQDYPNAKVVFVGPCASKKLEAMRTTVRSDVDFVVTFEELWGMFDAKGIVPSQMEEEAAPHDATAAGRGYAVAGGVAGAIEACLKEYYPDVPVHIEHAEGPGLGQSRKDQRLYDRRHGLPRRMYGRCRHQRPLLQILQGFEKISGFLQPEDPAKGTAGYPAGVISC